jgi:DNA-binding NarL/FixJ family response regulator
MATTHDGLTTRELEVLKLVAEGLSDAEVSDRLVVSRRTVHSHLRSIYRKLGVNSRGAATRYVVERELASQNP